MIGQNTINISPIELKKKGFSIRSGIVTQLDRKGADGGLLELGPSAKQLWMDLGESFDSFCGEEDQFPVYRGKPHANVLQLRPVETERFEAKNKC